MGETFVDNEGDVGWLAVHLLVSDLFGELFRAAEVVQFQRVDDDETVRLEKEGDTHYGRVVDQVS